MPTIMLTAAVQTDRATAPTVCVGAVNLSRRNFLKQIKPLREAYIFA